MKLTCNREKLLSAFQTVQSVAPSRSPKPILQNVKLEVGDAGATLSATDLEIGVRRQFEIDNVDAGGSAVLPVARLGSILRESSDEMITLEADSGGTLIKGQRSEFRLPGANPDEFPQVAEFSAEKYHELPARLLRELVRRTVFATDAESSRYALGGVLIELTADAITAVGTDGRRLATMTGPANSVGGHETGENTTIVPAKAMTLIERSLADTDVEARLAARGNDLLMHCENVTVFTRLVEGRFPKWREVFPRRDSALEMDIAIGPFHHAVRQAAILTSDDSRGVDFRFAAGTLTLSSRAPEAGESRIELPVPYDGPDVSIKLDPRFLNDFLRVLDPEKSVKVEIQDSESAVVCTTDDNYRYVIMPLAGER
ncbi:MAG: DNA polymerase III subunit beta [Pirellulales bacterium]